MRVSHGTMFTRRPRGRLRGSTGGPTRTAPGPASDYVFALTGANPVAIIVIAQAANGILPPIVAIFLLIVMNKRSLLGERRNHLVSNVTGGLADRRHPPRERNNGWVAWRHDEGSKSVRAGAAVCAGRARVRGPYGDVGGDHLAA